MDRDIYKRVMLENLRSGVEDKLTVVEGSVSNLIIDGGKARGVVMKDGERIKADAVVITTGTFLGG